MNRAASRLLGVFLAAASLMHAVADAAPPRPNVLVILADDLGYGDLSIHGCGDIATPHIDSIAHNGARCTDGYVAAPVCAPSRAGLMTGRHPERFGFQGNPARGATWGLPPDETTLADELKRLGYATGCIGKWHLGETAALHPLSRGFDEFFGFLSGMHSYMAAEDPRWGPVLRGREPAAFEGYLTDVFAAEAADFVRRRTEEPWFLYLAFNGVHTPLEATEEKLAAFAHIEDERRRTYAAMLSSVDDAVGTVLASLRETGQEDRTLVFFLSDNGAALIEGSAPNGATNGSLRGGKLQLWEGGIRVPFFVQWKQSIPAGTVVNQPVISLDIVPTALAAAGAAGAARGDLDGRNLLPLVTGASHLPVHERLMWRFYGRPAVREGDWKWVRHSPTEQGLFNLRVDPSEEHDRRAAESARSADLERHWRQWDATLPPPIDPSATQERPARPLAPAASVPKSTFNLIEYGADPTGRRDSSPAFDRIAAEAENLRHVHVVIPAGAYRLARRVVVSAAGNQSNYGIRVSGAGEDVTELLVDNPDGGLAFRGVGLNRLSCTISELSLVAVRENVGVALSFETANPGDHHARQFAADRILIRGERFDRGSFSAGVEVRNAWYPSLDNVKVTGPYGPAATDPAPVASGILLEDCYSPLIDSCYVWNARRGLVHRSRRKRPEDGIVRASYFVGCEEGIVLDLVPDPAQWPEPGFHVSDCHVNYRDRGIVMRGVRQATIGTTLFYCHDRTGTKWWKKEQPVVVGGDATTPRPYEPRDIDLVHAFDVIVSHNHFTEPANPKRVAIAIGKDSAHVVVSANQFNMGGTAIRNESQEPSYSSGNVFGGRPDWAAGLVRYDDMPGSLECKDF